VSKPDKPGELCDVELEAISLVTKAANGEKFKIFKSEKGMDEEMDKKTSQAPEVAEKDERGLFHVLKAFFSGEESAVEKGELADTFNAREKGRKLGVAIDSLWSTLKYDRWGGENKDAVTDPKKIRVALEDFKKIVEEILVGKDADLVKVAAEVEKSGRKISGARMAELKTAHAALSKIIEETDSEESEGETSEVTKEELELVVKGSVDEAVKQLNERLEQLEKSETPEAPETPAAESKPEDSTPDIAGIVKSAVVEATTPLADRLEKIEKARGFSNKIPEEAEIKKNASIFSGAFTAD
jgi:hypothetical protein